MDLITHTIVSTTTYKVATQQSLSFEDPGLIAVTVGAILPDIDIVTQIFGDVPYCKYHRGATHSILGILILSLISGVLLSFLFQFPFLYSFSFVLFGCLTHILLDILNSYGAQVFWPFSRKRVTLNLLVFIEPFMIIPFLAIIFFHTTLGNIGSNIIFTLVILYFALRYLSKLLLKNLLKKKFPDKRFSKVVVVPAFASIFHWDYILEDKNEIILGRATLTLNNFRVKKRLKKPAKNPFIKKALLSKLGKLFLEFTPHYFVQHEKIGDKHLVKFIDLRYLVEGGFVNSAFLKITEKGYVVEAFFQPYSEKRKIPLK